MTSPIEHTAHEVRSSDGTQIGSVTVGSGAPLVLVHGAWNWHEHWLRVAEELAGSHTCWVMDRRGRGSSGDGDGYSLDREIEDIIAVLDTAGPNASLLGHSSGGIYALETARRESVERLIVYEPPLRWAEQRDPNGMVERIRNLVDADQNEEATEKFFIEEVGLDEEGLTFLKTQPEWQPMVELAPICIREWDAILDAELSVERYRELSTPTLVLAGGENLDNPSMATESLAATLPNARTTVFEGHGHRAHITDPTLVANEVRDFLDGAT